MREENKVEGENVIYVCGTCSGNHRDSYIRDSYIRYR